MRYAIFLVNLKQNETYVKAHKIKIIRNKPNFCGKTNEFLKMKDNPELTLQ